MELRHLMRKPVVVSAGGMEYAGTLIEVTENEVLLKTDRGFVSVQMSRVTSIRDKNEVGNFASNRFIDQSFYAADFDGDK